MPSAGSALLNRKGTTWRRLDEAQRDAVHDAAAARALMLAQPSVIKRPVVQWPDGRITVGFDAADWAERVKAELEEGAGEHLAVDAQVDLVPAGVVAARRHRAHRMALVQRARARARRAAASSP